MGTDKYRTLKPEKIIATQRRLRERIARRFPQSGLRELACELELVAETAMVRAERIRRPNLPVRITVLVLLLAGLALVIGMARFIQVRSDLREVMNLVQFVEAGLGTMVFLGAAVLFLVTLELRLRRKRALAALHELRSIAHVVDMHQLAKDPDGLVHHDPLTAEGKEQTTKTRFELNRYLTYCNELLAIISKIAALYVQDFPDASSVAAVDDIEALCSGLSQKICQKILVLDRIDDGVAR